MQVSCPIEPPLPSATSVTLHHISIWSWLKALLSYTGDKQG